MSKKKYRYNPRKLVYEEYREGVFKKIFRWLLFTATSVLLGLILAYFFTRKIDSPKEIQLSNELQAMKLRYYELNHDLQTINQALDAIEQRDKDLYRVALYADQFPEEYRQMGTGGSQKYDYLSTYNNGQLMQETSKALDAIEQRILGQSLSLRELQKLAKNKEKLLRHVPAIQPVRNKELKRISSGFGYRVDPVYKTRRLHSGIDFVAKKGTEIYATGDGIVEEVENNRWGYGKSIVINHGFGYKTRYGHMSAFNVRKGQKVTRGELIGLVGNTGKSTGTHLHYEVILNGNKINPVHFFHNDLTPEEYEKVLQMSQQSYRSFD